MCDVRQTDGEPCRFQARYWVQIDLGKTQPENLLACDRHLGTAIKALSERRNDPDKQAVTVKVAVYKYIQGGDRRIKAWR